MVDFKLLELMHSINASYNLLNLTLIDIHHIKHSYFEA